MDYVSLALMLLAVPRITRFVTDDVIFDRPRGWALKRLTDHNPHHPVAYLLLCPWCVSVYAGAAMGAAWWAWGDTRPFTALCVALAASHIAGMLAEKETD